MACWYQWWPNPLLPWGSLFDHIWSIAIPFGTPTRRAIFRLGHGAVNPWMVFVESVSWKPLLHPFAHGWIIIPSQGRKQRYVKNHQPNIMKIYRIYSSSIVRPAASWDSSPHHRPWTPGPGNWIAACLAKLMFDEFVTSLVLHSFAWFILLDHFIYISK